MSGYTPKQIALLGERYGTCVTDATSVVGLPRLARERPHDWRQILFAGVLPRLMRTKGLTLAELLQSGRGPGLLPKAGVKASSLRQPRACARRLVERLGGVSVLAVDEAMVRWLRQELEREGRSRSLINRDISMLRRVVRAVHGRELGGPRVLARTPRQRRGGTRRDRPVPRPWHVVAILEHLGDLSCEARVALAAGGGVWEAEAFRLRVGDVDMKRPRVWARSGRTDPKGVALGRWVYLPPWAMKLVRRQRARVRHLGSGALLFHKPGRPTVPAESCTPRVKVACLVPGHPLPRVYTLRDLRRYYQVVAREYGTCHELVRGTLETTRKDREPWAVSTAYKKSKPMAREWARPESPPLVVDWAKARVPRKVKWLGRWDPEVPAPTKGPPKRETRHPVCAQEAGVQGCSDGTPEHAQDDDQPGGFQPLSLAHLKPKK